ncbi:MAG: hypothetical protein GY859_10290 [Desulfobacterales bacterium]|nr:hypothetical protein [Desulfobacterales bacterium]
MLNLTPLEETTAVKEIIQISEEKGIEKGLDKGELIGKIHMAQSLMRKPLTPREKLVEQDVEDLNAILDMLKPELNKVVTDSA